ncbi:ESCRT-III subunit protein did4 [Metarhizium acridum]|uniref:ESCRT-III subunit protein did4 n=2 Tax=Metarhizium acridum TaxID=92637 RepID=UPI001C6ACF36|nr:ESCRT-III subunit protein did4 [Metarhizium acridum]
MDYVLLPKIELHAHLTGSVSRSTLHEIWKRKKASGQTDLEDPRLVMPEGKHDYNLQTFFPLFSSYIYNLLTDEESIRYAIDSVLQDFLADGVVYLELRTTPRSTTTMSAEAYITVLLGAIEEFEALHPQLHTRLILSIDRRHSIRTAESILDLAIRLQNTIGCGVVGIDLCGDPTVRPGGQVAVFTPVFEQASRAGLGITVHFAEAEASGSHDELRTLLSWNPGRLGHVIWEDEEAREVIAERELCLELCLSCNVQAEMVHGGFEGHHFGHWKDVKGPRISLATDDVGVFGSPLSNEYRLVAEHFHLDRPQICALARQGIEGIFAGEQEKQRLRDIMWKE